MKKLKKKRDPIIKYLIGFLLFGIIAAAIGFLGGYEIGYWKGVGFALFK